jgi:hypothetical protein
VVLVRVGVDAGSGGTQGPLFRDGSFDFVPIPDHFNLDSRTYGNTLGRTGRRFAEYFPASHRVKMRGTSMHLDPEFETFTYGDPNTLKARFRELKKGDLLVFYCGLQGWDFESPPALYIIGYFEVAKVGLAKDFAAEKVDPDFAQNFHVRHWDSLPEQHPRLVVVKGGPGSRLLRKAVQISCMGRDCRGRPMKILSPEMREVFGDFGGKVSIQRSSPRWVAPDFVERAAKFVRGLA